METLPPAESAVVLRAMAEHKERSGPLLEVLHATQSASGFVPKLFVAPIAESSLPA